MEETKLLVSNTIDSPDNRDLLFEDYLEQVVNKLQAVPQDKKRPYGKITLFDQGQVGACSVYGPTLANNGQNILEREKNGRKYKEVDPMTLWDKQKNHTYTLLSGLKSLLDEGLIQGYVSIPRVGWRLKDGTAMTKEKLVELMKKGLDLGNYITTGSTGVDWGRQYAYPMNVVRWTKTGYYANVSHCCNIVDYNDEKRVFVNEGSWGADYGDKGYTYISYDDVDKLFTNYLIIDKDDSKLFKFFNMREKAKQLVRQAKEMYEYCASDDCSLKDTQSASLMASGGTYATNIRNNFGFTDKDL